MYRIYLLAALIFLVRLGSGQTFNYAYHTGAETSLNMVGINSKSYYLEKSLMLNTCMEQLNLVGVKENGSELFRTKITATISLSNCQVVAGTHKNLLVFAGSKMYACDISGLSYKVACVDTTGSISWSFDFTKKIVALLALPNGIFDLVTPDTIYRYSPAGQFLTKISLGGGQFNSATVLMNGNILINYYMGASARFRTNTATGILVADVAATTSLGAMVQASGGDILGISGSNIIRYSPSLNLKHSTAITLPPNLFVTAFYLRNDTVFGVGHTLQNQPVYFLLDSTLSPLFQTTSNTKNSNCTGIYVGKNNRVHVIASTLISQPHPYTAYFQTGVTGNLNSKPDIGIKNFTVIDAKYEKTDAIQWHGKVNAVVTIQNFGSDTVKSLHLNHYAYKYVAFYCTCLVGLNKSYTVMIPPGDSATVVTGTFLTGRYNAFSFGSDSSISLNLCIDATVPNEMSDTDPSNDSYCRNLKLFPVGIKENSMNLDEIQIFPNPSSERIDIRSPSIINSLQIFDIAGKLLVETEVRKKQCHIDAGILKEGLYFFKINSENGIVIKKVLIN
jgi:hypothetical protein